MATVSAFSTSGEDAISRTVQIQTSETPSPGSAEFEDYYEIAEIAKQIESWDSLQFPDELLHDSVPVHHLLKARLSKSRDLYILADTSYGSCCVDEVAASHIDADVAVHYGHSCLSQTSRLPVIYVFGRKSLDVDLCVPKISDYVKTGDWTQINLKHEVGFNHLGDDVCTKLRHALGTSIQVVYNRLPTRSRPRAQENSSDPDSKNGTVAASPNSPASEDPVDSFLTPTATQVHDSSSADAHAEPASTLTVWIGDESPTLTKLLMTSEGRNIVSYAPRSGSIQIQSHLTNKMLMRRYALVQQARDADVFGILVGTLGVASYLPLLSHLRTTLKMAHKKSYTVSVGKINPSKLANFMEIECWIWVSCSEGMVDSKEFLRPIISPYELELALQPEPSWTGKYILDFDELLAKATLDDQEPSDKDKRDRDEPNFSLVTGKYRQAKRYGVEPKEPRVTDDANSTDLVPRNQDNAVAKLQDNAAAHFLQARSYQGLEPRVGLDEPSILEQGRSGIAKGYSDDHSG
ncbi:diphthamide biosynthesis protein [Rickenella mellea]|uniref:2-(3-amino-3-carboxypropyl)histidine synthase subunit 2 n=1 Tax=Rickenella mellea TaxID=50990 RepID=A0A4Y7PV16_9AGAM|nr:diphthamide biosynthesis protein [Rickenella mellea]